MGPGRIICIGPCQPKMTKVEVEELINQLITHKLAAVLTVL